MFQIRALFFKKYFDFFVKNQKIDEVSNLVIALEIFNHEMWFIVQSKLYLMIRWSEQAYFIFFFDKKNWGINIIFSY